MSELPEWIEQRLDQNLQRDLRQRDVAKVISESDEPYLSRTIIQQRLDEETGETFDKSTVIDRLTELVEQKVLMSDEVCGGQIYWIYDNTSEWPIPPDVDTEPVSDEMTVQEFFSTKPVIFAFLGIGAVLVSSLFMWVGGMISSNNSGVLGLQAADVLTGGFLLIFVGWAIIGSSILWWFARKPTFK